MKTFDTIEQYKTQAKENDIVVLEGKGIIDGINTLESKHDTYKVVTVDSLMFRQFRGRTNYRLSASSYDQKIAVLTKKEFNNLITLW